MSSALTRAAQCFLRSCATCAFFSWKRRTQLRDGRADGLASDGHDGARWPHDEDGKLFASEPEPSLSLWWSAGRHPPSFQDPPLARAVEDADLVHKVAIQFVQRMGAHAVPHLEERADHAAQIGDQISALTWLDLAEAAGAILSQDGN